MALAQSYESVEKCLITQIQILRQSEMISFHFTGFRKKNESCDVFGSITELFRLAPFGKAQVVTGER